MTLLWSEELKVGNYAFLYEANTERIDNITSDTETSAMPEARVYFVRKIISDIEGLEKLLW